MHSRVCSKCCGSKGALTSCLFPPLSSAPLLGSTLSQCSSSSLGNRSILSSTRTLGLLDGFRKAQLPPPGDPSIQCSQSRCCHSSGTTRLQRTLHSGGEADGVPRCHAMACTQRCHDLERRAASTSAWGLLDMSRYIVTLHPIRGWVGNQHQLRLVLVSGLRACHNKGVSHTQVPEALGVGAQSSREELAEDIEELKKKISGAVDEA